MRLTADSSIAEKIFQLRIATRKACMCEKEKNKKSTLSLKTKVLYCISRGESPKDICLSLLISAANLTIITRGLVRDGLITKGRASRDKRELCYALTDDGKTYLRVRLETVEKQFKNLFTTNKQYDEAMRKLDDALELFAFVNF